MRLREAARHYGVRLASLADLEAEACEFAVPLPDDYGCGSGAAEIAPTRG
jgi:hypothetical protein